MVAHVVLLRAHALLAPLRGRARGGRIALAAAGALAYAAIVAAAVIGARGAPADLVGVAAVGAGAAVVLAFFAGPFLTDRRDPLDARAFAHLPLSPGATAATTSLAGFVSVPVAAALGLDIAAAIAQDAPAGLAVGATALHVATCVVAARIGFAAADRVRAAGRSREIRVLVALAAIAAGVPLVASSIALGEAAAGVPPLLSATAGVVALSPIGAAAAAAGGSVAALAVALVTLAAGLAVWGLVVHRAFFHADIAPSRRDRRLGWFAMLPATATGAIGARSILYWATDVRYLANLAIVPIAGVLPVIPLIVAGMPPETAALVPLPIVACFLGWIAHNDLAYDSEALWMHIVAGVRGAADRVGRLVPVALLALPVLAATIALTATLAGQWHNLGALVGVALSLFLSAVGVSSVTSAAWPYPVARPGDSPFRQPQRQGARGVLAPAGALVVTVLVSAPTLVEAGRVVFGFGGSAGFALVLGVVTGLAAAAGGIAIGSLCFTRRGRRLMELALHAG
ncbi:hypothetical protein [Microbacterium excoecariae]|uniref:hypothetical protein n=1 Tax=Microbacterium excoecariae TaxID=2715210 RepID=UPI0014075796|nr:hypothetical protein [Microbacterium excoecariae]NHI17276.1 hypothetical protein [Microbacterium excoecariae]